MTFDSRAALAARGLRRLGKSIRHVGAQRHQAEEVAAVQREIRDSLLLDHRADRRIFGREKGRGAADFDGFANLPDLKPEIDTRRLLHLQLYACPCGRFEPLLLSFDVVHPGNQRRNSV